MRILPILFNTEMVRAILEERKTVTRRVVRFREGWNPKWTRYVPEGPVLYGSNNIPAAKCQYRPGDILYVRETWAESAEGYAYKADFDGAEGWGWRPSIHMPKEAARIFLRVTDVRVERLQEITEDGAIAEGVKPSGGNFALDDFEPLWDSTIKPADRALYGWDANPWVWIIEFERTDKPEGWPHGKA